MNRIIRYIYDWQSRTIIQKMETLVKGILRRVVIERLVVHVKKTWRGQVIKYIGQRKQVSIRKQVKGGEQHKALIYFREQQVEVGRRSYIISKIIASTHKAIEIQGFRAKIKDTERIIQGIIQGILQVVIIIIMYKGYTYFVIIRNIWQQDQYGMVNMMRRAKQFRKRDVEYQKEYKNDDLKKRSQFSWTRQKGMYDYYLGPRKMTKEEKECRDKYWKDGSIDKTLVTSIQKDTRYFMTQYKTRSGKHVYSKFIGSELPGGGVITHFERQGIQKKNLEIFEWVLTDGKKDDAATSFFKKTVWVCEHENIEKHLREHVFMLQKPSGEFFKIELPTHDAQNIFLTYLRVDSPFGDIDKLIHGNIKTARTKDDIMRSDHLNTPNPIEYLKGRTEYYYTDPSGYQDEIEYARYFSEHSHLARRWMAKPSSQIINFLNATRVDKSQMEDQKKMWSGEGVQSGSNTRDVDEITVMKQDREEV